MTASSASRTWVVRPRIPLLDSFLFETGASPFDVSLFDHDAIFVLRYLAGDTEKIYALSSAPAVAGRERGVELQHARANRVVDDHYLGARPEDVLEFGRVVRRELEFPLTERGLTSAIDTAARFKL